MNSEWTFKSSERLSTDVSDTPDTSKWRLQKSEGSLRIILGICRKTRIPVTTRLRPTTTCSAYTFAQFFNGGSITQYDRGHSPVSSRFSRWPQPQPELRLSSLRRRSGVEYRHQWYWCPYIILPTSAIPGVTSRTVRLCWGDSWGSKYTYCNKHRHDCHHTNLGL